MENFTSVYRSIKKIFTHVKKEDFKFVYDTMIQKRRLEREYKKKQEELQQEFEKKNQAIQQNIVNSRFYLVEGSAYCQFLVNIYDVELKEV